MNLGLGLGLGLGLSYFQIGVMDELNASFILLQIFRKKKTVSYPENRDFWWYIIVKQCRIMSYLDLKQ